MMGGTANIMGGAANTMGGEPVDSHFGQPILVSGH